MRFSLKKRYRLPSLPIAAALALLTVFYGLWIMELHLKPAFLAIAEAKATQIATKAINDVVREKVNQETDPDSLVSLKLDQQGRVVFIQPNTQELNRLSSDTTYMTQTTLEKLSAEKIYIPLGQVFGNPFFANMGPRVAMTILPVGTVEVKIVDTFEQAGINQTKHMIYLAVATNVKIVVPFVSKNVGVQTRVAVTEYVVVGEVPGTYVQLPMGMDANEKR